MTTPHSKHREDLAQLPKTMPEALRCFFTHPSPIILVVLLSALVVARIVVGEWTLWDALIPLAILAAWPIIEWVIHVFALHFKPVKLGRVVIDFPVARQHRHHHRNPYELRNLFIPTHVFLYMPLAQAVLWTTLLPSISLALTAMTFAFVLTLRYEWCHFIVHTRYVPKGRWLKRLWTNHRLHHFKNEKYWYGVSMLSGDWVLRTAPDGETVEPSPTVRTLGVLPASS